MKTWNYTEEVLPPEGETVVILNGNHEQALVYDQGAWWFPDKSMYVYFRPKLWRHLDNDD